MQKSKKINLYSDFNLDLFNDFLEKNINSKEFEIKNSEFNQIDQFLIQNTKSKKDNEILIIWISSKYFLKFLNLSHKEKKTKKLIKDQVTFFIDAIKKKSQYYDNILIPSLIIDNPFREDNVFQIKDDFSEKNLIEEINFEIKSSFKNYKNVFFVDINNWFLKLGANGFNSKMWYHAKIPFSFEFFEYGSKEISKIIRSIYYIDTKKLLILDLDNTLWGGILGDIGYDKINLGGHDIAGESFQDFQKEIFKLKKKGIILAICSKNNEKNVDQVFKKNNQMILKSEDFAIKKINWDDKAKNIAELLKELNLSSNAAVFFDDSKHERERVKSVFKDLIVPDFPEDPTDLVDFILKQDYFNTKTLTKEDKIKTKLYKDETKRENLRLKIKSNKDWLKELNINIKIERLTKKNYDRTLQLLNKTNQFNLSTNRYTNLELNKKYGKQKNELFVIEVSDKFGSTGITVILGISFNNLTLNVNDFVMSCRVFGREIEFSVLHFISKYAIKKKLNIINFNYKKTKKNLPTLEFLKKSKIKFGKKNFVWKNIKEYKKPNHIKINYQFK